MAIILDPAAMNKFLTDVFESRGSGTDGSTIQIADKPSVPAELPRKRFSMGP